MLWVDPTDPEVFAAVSGIELADDTEPEPEDQRQVNEAVAMASEILTMATAYLIHPAGTRTEEFIGRGIRRFSPLIGPVTGVTALARAVGETEHPVPYRLVGGTVYLTQPSTSGGVASGLVRRIGRACAPDETIYRLTYSYASTLTASARVLVQDYAREIFRWLTDDDECKLPDNVTSIDREGLGIQLATPQDFLDRGRTGMAKIDTWLAQVNAKRALRPSAVYTPDSPPGVAIGRVL